MAKKKDEQEKVKCGDCANGHPHKGLCVWCIIHDAGRVANSTRFCNTFKKRQHGYKENVKQGSQIWHRPMQRKVGRNNANGIHGQGTMPSGVGAI